MISHCTVLKGNLVDNFVELYGYHSFTLRIKSGRWLGLYLQCIKSSPLCSFTVQYSIYGHRFCGIAFHVCFHHSLNLEGNYLHILIKYAFLFSKFLHMEKDFKVQYCIVISSTELG